MMGTSTGFSRQGRTDEGYSDFEKTRDRLFGIAYRMLGSKADAEDAVQDAYLRWHQTEKNEIRSPEAWLISVATRLCVDRLRAAAAHRETYVGQWLPEPLVGNVFPAPDSEWAVASDLSMAFLLLLERLGPEERAAFLLHDVFDRDYSEIASIVGKSEASCRQMIHRARERVRRDQPRFKATTEDRIRLVEKFAAAVAARDEMTLLNLFAEDVSLTADGGGRPGTGIRIIHGPDRVARLFARAFRKLQHGLQLTRQWVNNEPGLVIAVDGKLFSVLAFETDGKRILTLYHFLNPEKLKHIHVPSE
jgi:RNA polymerase sigma-70 factor, ECF subfamily